jgi:HlyD family secretion protein
MSAAAPRKRPSFLRANLKVIVAVLLLAGVAGAIVMKRMAPLPVTVTPVVKGKAIDAVYATGTVEANDRVNVKAKTGGSIAELLVKEGQSVKKGDLLARIDNPIVTFDLKRGKAELSAANAQAGSNAPQVAALRAQADAIRADLQTARTDLARTEALVKGGSIAQADLDRARARVTQLEGQLAANEAQQRAVKIDLDANAQRTAAAVQSLASRVSDTEVRSPLDGVVLTRSIEIGEVVAQNQTLFKIGDTRDLILEVSVDEADVARVHDGSDKAPPSPAAVSLYAFRKEVFKGKVFEVRPDANRERKAFLVKVRLDNPPPGLRSGMSAEVNIIAREVNDVLLAPSEAESDGAVWVVEGNRARKRTIEVGIRDLLRLQVLSGLSEGDPVVVDGQDKLKEGARVSVTVRPADKMKPLPDTSQPNQTSVR